MYQLDYYERIKIIKDFITISVNNCCSKIEAPQIDTYKESLQ